MKKKGLSYQDQAGFKIPPGYFKDFEDRFLEQLASPGFPVDQAGKNPFKTPDNYFSDFQERLMQKVKQEESSRKVVRLRRRRAWSNLAGIAAVLAVILTSKMLGGPEKASLQEIDLMAVEGYIIENLEWTSPTGTLLPEDAEVEFAVSSDPDIDKEALLEYLQENIEEPALLLNQD